MYLVGLTGGIASGKTTVAARLVEHGAIEIDADILARKAVEPGSEGLTAIARLWPTAIKENGELDRGRLATEVFSDDDSRAELEAIVHPIVRRLASEAFSSQPSDGVVVYTVPLLVEANVDHPFDLVVTVEAPEAERIRRLVENRGLTPEDAKRRIESQVSSAARANRADIILNSNQPIEKLLADVDKLWLQIALLAKQKQEISGNH